MKILMLGSLAAAALTLGMASSYAQSQPEGSAAVTLTPEQRAAVRSVIRERLTDEMRDKLADRLSEGLATLTPEQRDAIRNAIRERLAVEVREGLSDRLMPSFAQMGDGPAVGAMLTPEQRCCPQHHLGEACG